MVTVLWWAVGYSLVFGKSFGSPFLGGIEFFFLQGVTSAPNTDYGAWVSQNVFSMYQLMFAIITPALIVGAIAERMKYSAIMLFILLWMFVVYFPLAHMVWGVNGFMNGVWNARSAIPAIDFAGGTVVHMSSGLVGARPVPDPRQAPGLRQASTCRRTAWCLCMVGTGHALGRLVRLQRRQRARRRRHRRQRLHHDHDRRRRRLLHLGRRRVRLLKGKPSVLGFCSGAVAGLVVITPAAGFVDPTVGAPVIGLLAGLVPFLACTKLKEAAGYDDALDTFGVHAVGGTLGAILTGVLATASVNGNLTTSNTLVNPELARLVRQGGLAVAQLKAAGLTLLLTLVGSMVLILSTKFLIGLRPSPEVEREGLDIAEHGEEGYTTA